MFKKNNLMMRISCVVILVGALVACDQQKSAAPSADTSSQTQTSDTSPRVAPSVSTNSSSTTNLFWGDTHLHTNLSPDAFIKGNTTATPDDSFNFAKGAPVIDANSRAKIQIDTPLDFLVVTDHAEYVGIPKMIWGGDERLIETETGKHFAKLIQDGNGTQVFVELLATVNSNEPIEVLNSNEIRKSIWSESVAAAERHNDPGKFTAFIGWEWSSLPNGQNLHRIVFTPQGGDAANKFIPFSAFDSDVESELWKWLDKTSKETGADFVAIPHNGNISNGLMFPVTDRAGNPITREYANQRMRWEQVIEMTQIKGDSETHPVLSPDDEFADFETFEHLLKADDSDIGHGAGADTRVGSYTRSGLKRGLELEQEIGVNPFKYGMIGATDSHSGYSSAEENNFWGKFSQDSIPDNKKDVDLLPGIFGWDMSASGLSGVWATENTRQSIADAFKRREVYGTSGPRISLRFFGGFEFTTHDASAKDISTIGYKRGVPMGADLANAPDGKAPSFLIHAVKDPKDANLDRIQMVKGWVDAERNSHEKVFDIAWSDNRKVGADGKLPAVGTTVDLKTGLYDNSIGTSQLSAVWHDPDFNSTQKAFYYVRVLQIPTPRNSTYDAIALGIDPEDTGHSVIIQERAYSSPIWYTP